MYFTDDAPVCETKQRRLERACSGLVLHKTNDYPQFDIWAINIIVDEVNDYQKEKVTSSTSISKAFNVYTQALYHIINAMSN